MRDRGAGTEEIRDRSYRTGARSKAQFALALLSSRGGRPPIAFPFGQIANTARLPILTPDVLLDLTLLRYVFGATGGTLQPVASFLTNR